MRLVRSLLVAFALLLAPKAAHAVSLQLVMGADGWIHEGGVFDLTFSARTYVTRHLSVGGRLGAAFVTSPSTLGVPLDLVLRGDISRFYIEGVVGPWILFTDDPVRAHAGIGFGIRTHVVSVGLELAYLDPNGMIGLRVAIPL